MFRRFKGFVLPADDLESSLPALSSSLSDTGVRLFLFEPEEAVVEWERLCDSAGEGENSDSTGTWGIELIVLWSKGGEASCMGVFGAPG